MTVAQLQQRLVTSDRPYVRIECSHELGSSARVDDICGMFGTFSRLQCVPLDEDDLAADACAD